MTEKISSTEIMDSLRSQLSKINATVDQQEASVVTAVGDGIAHVSGLRTAMAGELLEFTSSSSGRTVYGLAQNLDEDEVGAVLFGDVDIFGDPRRHHPRATSAAPRGASGRGRCGALW